MKYFLLAFCLFCSFCLFATDIFRADESDPYRSASFAETDKLNQLLENEQHSTFATAFEQEFGSDFDTEKQYEALKHVATDQWEMQLFDKRRKQLLFLKNHESSGKLTPEFVQLVKTNIDYNYWHLLLAYSINRSNENTGLKTVISLPEIMTESLEKTSISDDSRLMAKSYREFLPFYITYFNSKANKFKKYTAGVQSVTDKTEFAEKHLNGNVLDYARTRIIAQYHLMLTPASFGFLTGQIRCEKLKNYLNTTYLSKVTEAETARMASAASANKEQDKDQKINFLDLNDKTFSFDTFKGKVVYIDFWASWCGPCRQEFPYSKKIHESLTEKQRKDIVFLYISIDENIEKWKEAVNQLGLKEFGQNGHSFEITNKYQIRSIPRYMIMDKNGKIINSNAPRPSSPETLNTLIKLL
jgi:thiol-disulfide isomerase/thioredoxin